MIWLAPFFLIAGSTAPNRTPSLLDQAYREMYNLNFAAAHRALAEWEKAHPEDPMGPVSDAAAYLFSEFDRLHILEAEFFTNDSEFASREKKVAPDAALKRSFDAALERGERLSSAALARNANDENAQLASVLRLGLQADYLFLIERRNLAAFSQAKQARQTEQRLLAQHPECYDAYLAEGIENYLLSLKPMPMRWALRMGGGHTDRHVGIERLKVTAEKGRYLRPYARLLLVVAELRDKDVESARRDLSSLAAEFPNNRLYRAELAKLPAC